MKPQGKAPWYVRLIFWLQARTYGAVLDSGRVWATSPRVFLHLSLLYGALDRKGSPISPSVRSLVIVRVSQLNGCAFCVDLNTSILIKRGVPLDKALALSFWRDSPLFSDLERSILAYTESVTLGAGDRDPALQTHLTDAFGEVGLVELTALIAFQNMSTKFNNAFGIAPQGFCAVDLTALTSTTSPKESVP